MPSKRKPGGRHNSLRDGIFAKELVIASAGESEAEFEHLLSQLRDDFNPGDLGADMLVTDLATTQWRLQRIRRCEAAEIRVQLATAPSRTQLERIAEVKNLKSRFFLDHLIKFAEPYLQKDFLFGVDRSIEGTRRRLERTPLGLEFLIERLKDLSKTLETQGYLPDAEQKLLFSVCGVEAEKLHGFRGINDLAKSEQDKAKRRQKAKMGKDETSATDKGAEFKPAEGHKIVLLMMLGDQIHSLKMMNAQRELLEAAEEKAYPATLLLLPLESQERIHRAEAALERRFYKSLDRLYALRKEKSSHEE